jgi:hypothetical protein
MEDSVGKCNICKDVYTTNHVVIEPDTKVYVCAGCIEKAKNDFIWICLSCGKSYVRPKELVINRIKDHELKRAYMLCQDLQVIQGIDMCMACDPERIVEYMELQYSGTEC